MLPRDAPGTKPPSPGIRWFWPVPKSTRVSQRFGNRNAGYAAGYHTGVDFSVPIGTHVVAIADGTVHSISTKGAYGKSVVIRHRNGTYSRYAHLSAITVRVGQVVSGGKGIALSGNTGNSTGPHLHLEVSTSTRYGVGLMDPIALLSGKKATDAAPSARRTSGGGSSSTSTSSTSGGGSVAKKEDLYKSSADYGYVRSFLNAFPELKKLFAEAVREDWSPDKLQQRLRDTSWWRKRTEAQREYDTNRYNDPAQWRRSIAEAKALISANAGQMGVRLTSDQVTKLAEKFVRDGSTEAEQRLALASYWKAGTALAGQAADTADQVNELSAAYGVDLSAAKEADFIKGVLGGRVTIDTVEDYYREAAKKLFPAVATQLDSSTTADILDPYLALAQQELGVIADNLRLTDPKWTAPLRFKDAKGNPAVMDLDDWQTKLRTDTQYGWDTTPNARQAAAEFAQGIAERFGAI